MYRKIFEQLKLFFKSPVCILRKKLRLRKEERIINELKKLKKIEWPDTEELVHAECSELEEIKSLERDIVKLEKEIDDIWLSDDPTDSLKYTALLEDDTEVKDSAEVEKTSSPTKGLPIKLIEKKGKNDPLSMIEFRHIEKVNAYRIAQGDTAAMMLPGLTEVARYRANELTTNFSHTSPRDACGVLKYGEFVDMTLYGLTAEDSYYQGFNREAIGMGDWFGTAESMSDRIAHGFHHSKGHWSYVGSSKYPYIAVGVTKANGKWYVCICMSEENYGG